MPYLFISLILVAILVVALLLILPILLHIKNKSPAGNKKKEYIKVVFIALFFVVSSSSLYLYFGSGKTLLNRFNAQQTIDNQGIEAIVASNITKLKQQVVANPSDSRLREALARHYELSGDYANATQVYKKLHLDFADNLYFQARYLQFLNMISPKITPEIKQQLAKLQTNSPKHPLILIIKARDAHENKKYLAEAFLWEQLMVVLESPAGKEQAQLSLQDAMALFSKEQHAKWLKYQDKKIAITLVVALADDLKAVINKNDTLFVTLKKAGQAGMPIAAKKLVTNNMPISLVITDADVIADLKLNSLQKVDIKAQVSKSGEPSNSKLYSQTTINLQNNPKPTLHLTIKSQ